MLGCEDSRREELSPSRKQTALLESQTPPPTGFLTGRSPFLLVLPGVSPRAPLVSPLSWWTLGATRGGLQRGGRCGWVAEKEEGEKQWGVGCRIPVHGHCVGDSACTCVFTPRFKGNFTAASFTTEAGLALGEMASVLRFKDLLFGSSFSRKREV